MSFGTLDPSSGSAAVQPVVATTTFANMAGDCNPTNQTMTISISGSSSRQLVNSAGDTIAYSISGLPLVTSRPGNNNWTTWFGPGQISGSIAWSAYADAPAGLYQDTVTIVVNP